MCVFASAFDGARRSGLGHDKDGTKARSSMSIYRPAGMMGYSIRLESSKNIRDNIKEHEMKEKTRMEKTDVNSEGFPERSRRDLCTVALALERLAEQSRHFVKVGRTNGRELGHHSNSKSET